NHLLVMGDSGDTVKCGAGWTTAVTGGTNGNGTSTIGGEIYQIYTAGQAILLVDTDVSTVAAQWRKQTRRLSKRPPYPSLRSTAPAGSGNGWLSRGSPSPSRPIRVASYS